MVSKNFLVHWATSYITSGYCYALVIFVSAKKSYFPESDSQVYYLCWGGDVLLLLNRFCWKLPHCSAGLVDFTVAPCSCSRRCFTTAKEEHGVKSCRNTLQSSAYSLFSVQPRAGMLHKYRLLGFRRGCEVERTQQRSPLTVANMCLKLRFLSLCEFLVSYYLGGLIKAFSRGWNAGSWAAEPLKTKKTTMTFPK